MARKAEEILGALWKVGRQGLGRRGMCLPTGGPWEDGRVLASRAAWQLHVRAWPTGIADAATCTPRGAGSAA